MQQQNQPQVNAVEEVGSYVEETEGEEVQELENDRISLSMNEFINLANLAGIELPEDQVVAAVDDWNFM